MPCNGLLPPLRSSEWEGMQTGGYALPVFTPGYSLFAPPVLSCVVFLLSYPFGITYLLPTCPAGLDPASHPIKIHVTVCA